MSSVRLENAGKKYGETEALHELSIEINNGEFVALLGRPGAGKSTTLKIIAGIEELTGGSVYLDERTVTNLLPEKRNVSMAFESYALYPHMSVRDNLEFPLRAPGRQLSGQERTERVSRVAELLEIAHLLDRKPSQLSGGQRQRVSLGRALVRPASVTLLDEPIAHLDARLRYSLRGELKHYQRDTGATTIYATPDFTEAASVSDRIAVLIDGKLRQFATPAEVYDAPADIEVAQMAGDPKINLFRVSDDGAQIELGEEGTASKRVSVPPLPPGVRWVGIRPTRITLNPQPVGAAIEGKVYVTEPMGYDQVVRVDAAGHLINVKAPLVGNIYKIGQSVWLQPDWQARHMFDTAGKRWDAGFPLERGQ